MCLERGKESATADDLPFASWNVWCSSCPVFSFPRSLHLPTQRRVALKKQRGRKPGQRTSWTLRSWRCFTLPMSGRPFDQVPCSALSSRDTPGFRLSGSFVFVELLCRGGCSLTCGNGTVWCVRAVAAAAGLRDPHSPAGPRLQHLSALEGRQVVGGRAFRASD